MFVLKIITPLSIGSIQSMIGQSCTTRPPTPRLTHSTPNVSSTPTERSMNPSHRLKWPLSDLVEGANATSRCAISAYRKHMTQIAESRKCPGRHFALDGALIAIASVLHCFDISPTDEAENSDERSMDDPKQPIMTSGLLRYDSIRYG